MTKEEQLKIYSAYLPYGLHFYPSENSDLFHDLYADNFPYTNINYKTALLEGDKDAVKISESYLKQKSPFIAIEDNELFLGQFESSLGFDVDDVFASEVKPVLYPLEYLTKEIEHEGKILIPVEELAKLHVNWDEFDYDLKVKAEVKRQFNLKVTWKRKNTTDEYHSDDLFIMTERWNLNKYWVIQKLLEWHFNVFQLPEDQFINKATLTNK